MSRLGVRVNSEQLISQPAGVMNQHQLAKWSNNASRPCLRQSGQRK